MYKRAILILLPIIIGFLIVNTAKGQEKGVGIKSGLNVNTHIGQFQYQSDKGNVYFRPNFKIGYQIGFTYRYIFGPNTRVQVEPGLTSLGASYSDSYPTSAGKLETESHTNLLYASLPLLFQLTTTPPDRLEFPQPWAQATYHLTGGIFGGYLLNANHEGTLLRDPLGTGLEENFSRDILSEYSKFDAGIVLGFGMEYGLDTKFGFELRAKLGVLKTTEVDSPASSNPRNISFDLIGYYMF